MTVRDERRAAALDRIADHMLAHGLAFSSLRALAEAAGTSDRMLLYYFADKDDIFSAALQTIAGRLAALLFASLPQGEPKPAEAVLQEVAAIVRGAAVRPYMRVWLEVTVLSARGEEPFRSVAGGIADAFIAWVSTRLAIPDDVARQGAAARLVTVLDGLVVLDLVGREGMSDLALAHPLA